LCQQPQEVANSRCQLISLAEKELTTGSNCFGKLRHGVILKVQLIKKACSAFP